jgi:hypothetical protein
MDTCNQSKISHETVSRFSELALQQQQLDEKGIEKKIV